MDDFNETNELISQINKSPILNNTCRKSYYIRNENTELPTIYEILKHYLRKDLQLSRDTLENYYKKVTTMKLHHVKNRWLLLKIRGMLEYILKKRIDFNTKIQDGRICIFENLNTEMLTKTELENFYQQLLNRINAKFDNKHELMKFLRRLDCSSYEPENRWLVLKIKGLLKYILKTRGNFMKSLSHDEITIFMEDDEMINHNDNKRKTASTSDIPLTNDDFITIELENNGNIEEISTTTDIPLTNNNFITIEVQNNDNKDGGDSDMEIDNEIFHNMGSLPDLPITIVNEQDDHEVAVMSEKSFIFTKQENHEFSTDLFEEGIFKVPPLPQTRKIDNLEDLEDTASVDHDYCLSQTQTQYSLASEQITERMSMMDTIEQSNESLKGTYEDCKQMLAEFVGAFQQLILSDDFNDNNNNNNNNNNDKEMTDITTISNDNTQIYNVENSRIIEEVVDRFKHEIRNEPQPIFKEADFEHFGFF